MGQIKKWDTWFSANIRPINFKQRPNCSLHESCFACLRQDDCILILQSTNSSSACPICIRNGTVAKEMGHLCLSSSLIDRQASNLKGSSMRPLRHELLIFETVRNSPAMANYHNIHKESEIGHPWDHKWDTFSLQMLELSISHENRSACSSPHRWSADAEQASYIPMSQRAIASYWCPKMHQKWDTWHMNWASQSDVFNFRWTPISLTQEVVPCFL